MQEVKTITVRLPQKAVATLERAAEKDYVTLESFVEQRLSELLQYIVNSNRRAVSTEAAPQLAAYL